MANKIKRIYVAGLLTPRGMWSINPAIDYLLNVRNMIRAGIELLLAGYDPFIPALDFSMFLELRDDERITEPMIKRFSKSWLEVCDAIYLTKGWQQSSGTLVELEVSRKLGQPSFESIEEIKEYEASKTRLEKGVNGTK
jgi:hypothetical protein